jgi:two-component system phosphate regulon response regulator PhoB
LFITQSENNAPLKLGIVMSESKKILIVDEEEDILTYFEAIFNDNGYDTLLARDGIKGFELAKSEKPDLIALDITMPKQSGLKIYRQLKDHPELKNIPVIIITAVNDSFKIFIDKLKEVEPPEGILNKPIDPQEILKVVRGILSN